MLENLHLILKIAAAVLSIVIGRALFKFTSKWAQKEQEDRGKRKITRLLACQRDLVDMISKSSCNPIMLRLAFSDAGTFDKNIRSWPAMGGANGSIRFDGELTQPSNAGLSKAIALLQPVKKRNPTVSWADLIQMAGAMAVEIAGGPKITMKYGRIDAPLDSQGGNDTVRQAQVGAAQAAKLPCANAPYPDGSHSAEFHIRTVFYRMGFSSREVVALCGAHTIGRAFKDRSGVCAYSSGDRGATRYTRPTAIAKGSGEGGIGMAGGMSWTSNWLQFDNSYFKRPLLEGKTALTSLSSSCSMRSTTSSRGSSHRQPPPRQRLLPPSNSQLGSAGAGAMGAV